MTTIEIAALEAALSSAFQGGELRRRELRLTAEEAEYMALRWEGVRLTPLSPSGDKMWYLVELNVLPA
ncbi:hypothetical protein [Pseudoflavonifractor capillosus]|uniref:Uncharacterized protein n=1 Tax=Pseudoflavonifractor capillosus TaxID=106588 RepID=A0A921MJY6_9FIRM|nr:hypothetical protein [Pseudoflavonifractor capillosus]HJG85934.1 hypothetical protein [Pseudoflavonifractor capillosus]